MTKTTMTETLDPRDLAARAGTLAATEIAILAASTDFSNLALAASLCGRREAPAPETWLRLELGEDNELDDLLENLEDLEQAPAVVHLVTDCPQEQLIAALRDLAKALPEHCRLVVGDHDTIGTDAAAAKTLAGCGAIGVGPGAGLPARTSVDAALAGGLEPWLELRLQAAHAPQDIAAELLTARALAAEHCGRPWHLSPANADISGFATACWIALARLAFGPDVTLLIDPVAARPKLAQLTVAAGADGWSRVELETEAGKRPLQERADPATAKRLLTEV